MNPESKEISSLAGKIDKLAMGKNIEKEKPKKPKTNKKKKNQAGITFRGGNILNEKFDDIIYRPKTKENQLIYQSFLGRLNQIVEDHTHETLISMADEILALIRGEGVDLQKKEKTEIIIGQKMGTQNFFDLINIGKSLTDYEVEKNEEMNEENIELYSGQEEEEDSENNILSDIESLDEQVGERKRTTEKEKMKIQENQNVLNANSINAHWLNSQLNMYYEATEAQSIEKQIMESLNSQTNRQAENKLLDIFNYSTEKGKFIELLVKNRYTIYYCTRYHQAQSQKEKDHLSEQMKQYNVYIGKKQIKVKKEKERPEHPEDKMQDEGENQLFRVQMVKDDEINKIPKKVIELDLHDSSDRTGLKQQYKFKIPSNATKSQKQGYEEVVIEAKTPDKSGKLRSIESLPSWMRPVFEGIKYLNLIQSQVCDYALECDRNLLVCAPTSAGKTNVALLCMLQTIGKYILDDRVDTSKFKIVYIAPMKALVSQITGNLSNKLKPLNINVKELTGDMHLSKNQIEETQVIVATPQKWDIITRKAGDRIFTELVKLLIIDEIHLLSDDRGPVLESLIARTMRQSQTSNDYIRIVGLSATLPNYKDVGATLRVSPNNGLYYFDQSFRPVPLKQIYCGVTQKKGVRKMMLINEILYEKVIERVSNNQMIIFVHSRRDTARTAKYLRDTAFSKNQSQKIIKPNSENKKILEALVESKDSDNKVISNIKNEDLKELLPEGIGIHHAGLSRSDRDTVENLFASKNINILVSTATLAWGVNLPAYSVIIKGTQVYSPEEGRWIQLSLQDVMQMLGRAGRPRFDTQGQGIIITGSQEVRYYLNLLNMKIPLQSQMLKTLPDQLNAQIVLGSVNNIKQGVNWLSYTYLFIRMLKNPKHYSIPFEQIQENPQLLRRRVNLVHTAATILQKNGLINYDRKNGSFNSTFLGKISSNFYVKYPSMKIYNSNLKSTSSIIQLFKVFSMSLQFKHLSVRDQEKRQLQKLLENVPIPIKGSLQETTTKISALLQAHISRLQLDGFALNVDKVFITQSASRIMRALFQISLKRGWGQVTLRCLQMAKMIDKSMWNCNNPLKQIKQVPQSITRLLQNQQSFTWESFYQMDPQQIGNLIKQPKLGKILYKLAHNIPRVQINAYAQPITRSCLKIDLNIKSDFKWQKQYHGREEPFWIFVLDCDEQNILYSFYFTLTEKQDVFYTQFIVPLFQVQHPLYFIKVVSDRWICPDNNLPLSFKNMILPKKFPAPNEILDLQLIPTSSLPPIAKNLKINYLNQIQTQIFNSFMKSNKNLFVGAAEGSGKFTLALFAAYKCLTQENKKVVIMFPYENLTSKQIQLSKLFPHKKVGRTYGDLAKDSGILLSMDIILTTPEAWDVVSRRWKARKGFNEIGLFIIENLHMVSEGLSTMQVVVSRMRYITSQLGEKAFRIIGLSTSVADYEQIGEWIGATSENIFNFHPNIRQNMVEIIFSNYDQHLRESRLYMMQKNVIHNVRYYNRKTITFVSDKRQMKLTALDFMSLLSIDEEPKKLRKKINDEAMKTITKAISDQYLVHVLQYGVGYVYEGMDEKEKYIILELFENGSIKLLVATQALKWQLSVKAFIVAVLDVSYFNCLNQRWTDYTISEMIQFMSFAETSDLDKNKGKQYSSAKFMIMCHGPKKNFYKKFLFEPFPVQSSLHLHLANHLNSNIVSKAIQSKEDCIDWLTWTLMYRRLTQNPNYYNMQQVSEQGISTYLSELIETTIQYLQGIKCVQVEGQDENELTATNLGIVCSYYYINVQTLANFLQKLTQNISMKSLMEMISQAAEFSSFSYRPNEHQLINRLLTTVHESANNKVYGLLRLHVHRIPVPADILYQIKQILPICIRLIHSLVDVITSLGFLKPLIMNMQLCKMLIQAMLIDQPQLLQLMDSSLVQSLKKNFGINEINDFFQMEEEDREKALKGKDVKKIALACNRYSIVSLKYEEVGREEDQVVLKVILERDEELEEQTIKVICPYYPEEKDEYWWVVVGDKKTNKILATKRTLFKNKSIVDLTFQVLKECEEYTLYALCDSYFGCDQAEEFKLT